MKKFLHSFYYNDLHILALNFFCHHFSYHLMIDTLTDVHQSQQVSSERLRRTSFNLSSEIFNFSGFLP